MGRWFKTFAIIAIVIACLSAYTPPSRDTSGGKFRLLNAQIDERTVAGGSASYGEVFLIDSDTGKVWIFREARATSGDTKYFTPEHFESVFVDDITGNYDNYLLKLNRGLGNTVDTKK